MRFLAPVLVLMLLLTAPVLLSAEARPRHILLAIADDWGCHAGAYGTPWVKTPGFDRVAAEGVRFSRAYTPVAKCAPSRAILLTGRQAWQLEAAGNHLAIFPPHFKSWPEVLKERGWHTGRTGKGWAPGLALDAQGQPREIAGPAYDRRRLEPPTTGIAANDYAANFEDFLEAAPPGKPWCFWFGAAEPHRGYDYQSGVKKGGKKLSDIDRVPEMWPDDERVRHDLLDYAYEVEHFDRHLLRMLESLERRGLLDETLVIVTSDHGMPFPRAKGYAYPASNHVPLAIRWPGGIQAPGRVVEDFVSFVDLAATVLDYAGISWERSGMKPLSGKSWRPLLESAQGGRIEAWRDHVLIGKERTDVGRPQDQGYPIRGLLREDYLFLRNYEPGRWPAGNPETGYLDTDGGATKTLLLERGRRDRSDPYWQLNFGMRPPRELYDLAVDPDAVVNLALSPGQSERCEAMERELTARLQEQGDPRMFGEGERFDHYPVHAERLRQFYERFLKGEIDPRAAGWVDPGDFEPAPLPRELAPPP